MVDREPRAVIRMFCDYGATFPLWWAHGSLPPSAIDLSERRVDELRFWAMYFDEFFDDETLEWRPPADAAWHSRRGAALAEEVAAELGHDFAIEYQGTDKAKKRTVRSGRPPTREEAARSAENLVLADEARRRRISASQDIRGGWVAASDLVLHEQQLPGGEVLKIQMVWQMTREYADALVALLPELSTTAQIDRRRLEAVIRSKATDIFFARVNNHVLGMATLVSIPLITGYRGHVEDLAVEHGPRGQDIARALLETIVTLSRRKMRTLDLTSRPDSVAAIALYEAVGFRRHNALVMRQEFRQATDAIQNQD
jgi:ribosomal protein S18 acetylase RimI-like enzyme